MTATIKAIYDNGILRLKQPLPLSQGQEIEFSLTLPEPPPVSARFSWENGHVLASDSFAGSVSEELRRQRDEE